MKYRILTLLLLASLRLCAQQQVTFRFVGDLMQHSTQFKAALQPDGTYCYDTSYAFIRSHFQEADWTVINMETVFDGTPYSGYPLFSSPDNLAIDTYKAGANVFLTANNHIVDRGLRGVQRTLALYDSIGVTHTGTTADQTRSTGPLLLERNGIRVALINGTYSLNGNKRPAQVHVGTLDSADICNQIQVARLAYADFIICCMHWGNEYQMKPSTAQRTLAEALKRYGADAVIGSHPHVPQGIEVEYDSEGGVSFITAYSLGNFLSNQPDPESRMGLMLGFTLEKKNGVTRMIRPFYEWVWTWKPVVNGKRTYYAVPVSDPRLYRQVMTPKSDTVEMIRTLQTLRNFMLTNAPAIDERKRTPDYERKNLYFGEYPSFSPLWTEQSFPALVGPSLPTIENRSPWRGNQSTRRP